MSTEETFTFKRYIFAWSIHLFTALGAVFGFLAIIDIGKHEWMRAFVWMAIAVFIDSFDGILARYCRIREVLPNFDGALLDNVVDYFTYVIVPASFLYETHYIPQKFNLFSAIVIVLSSAYQFCQADAKTEDHWFKGFPSYWNIVVLYIFLLELPKTANFIIILVLAILVFVPIKYLYPSRVTHWKTINWILVLIWSILIIFSLYNYPSHKVYTYLSLVYVVYYFIYSFYWSIKKSVS